MNFIIWLVVGGVLGWLASLMMRTDGQQGVVLNVVVGIVGAFLGGLLISPLVGAGNINDGNFSLPSLLVWGSSRPSSPGIGAVNERQGPHHWYQHRACVSAGRWPH